MRQFCSLHLTILKNKAEKILLHKILQKLDQDKGLQFIDQIKSLQKENQVTLHHLEQTLKSYQYHLSERDLKTFIDAYSTKADQTKDQILVNIEKLTDLEKTQ